MQLPPVDVARLVAERRDFHAHPELAYEEARTAGIVADQLRALGYELRTHVGGTGVVGVRRGGGHDAHDGRQRCVLLRADMDALPICEANDVPYRSTVDGVMHACGHDGHVAVGLAVARRLAELPVAGTVKMAFQPAEEGGGGASAMIRDGALRHPAVDAAFGVHLWSELPTGTVGVTAGPVFASVDRFEITITGRGGHAAAPHHAVDPVVAAAHVVTMLQTLISRRRNPMEEAVLSVTALQAGTAFNVIPDTAVLQGTVRTYGGAFFDEVPTLVERLVSEAAQALGAEADVQYRRTTPAAVNDPALAELMAEVAAGVVGRERVERSFRTMAGDDMAAFLRHVPGCYALVGCRNAGKGAAHPHHSPHFDIDEDSLPIAAELLSRTALEYLRAPG